MARDVNRELLELAAFEGEELEKFYPIWVKTAEKLQLTDDKVAYAVDTYLPQNWDLKYLGVRKMIGAYLREVAEICDTPNKKANGVKIVYGILPAIANYYYAVKESGGDKVFIGFPDLILVNVLNSFFHSAAPFLNEAEKMGFTYGCRHCPLNKMRVAAYTTGTIAAPDLIWSWGFNCDEGPKTDEFIQGITGKQWRYHVSRVPHDGRFDEQEDMIEDRVRFMSEQMKLGVKAIEEATGIEVTDEHLALANKHAGAMGFKVGMLTQMTTNSNPPVLGGETLTMLQQCLTVPFNTGFKYMEMLSTPSSKSAARPSRTAKALCLRTPRLSVTTTCPSAFPGSASSSATTALSVPSHTRSHCPSLSSPLPSTLTILGWLPQKCGPANGMCRNLAGEAESMIEKVEMCHPDGMILGFFDFTAGLALSRRSWPRSLKKRPEFPPTTSRLTSGMTATTAPSPSRPGSNLSARLSMPARLSKDAQEGERTPA